MDLRVAWINLNRNCNMHCRFCYAGSRLEDTDVIDTNKIEQIIKILNRTNIKKVILLGGEPTLYKDLEKVIFQFKKNNIKVVLQTNGLVLTEARWKNLFTQIECSVSIKAFSEETYRRITGRKDYNNYEAIIRQVIKAYPFIQYTYVLDLFDKKMIDEIVRGIEKTGIKQILISSEQIDIENKNRSDIDLFEIGWAYQELFYKLKKNSVKVLFSINIPLCIFEDNVIFDFLNHGVIQTRNCQLINPIGVVIDTDYSLLPCIMFTELEKKEISLFDNVNRIDVVYEKYKRKYSSLVPENCKDCSLWKYCMGGCELRWKDMDADKYLRKIDFKLESKRDKCNAQKCIDLNI